MSNPGDQRTWRLKPEERGRIRTTIQLAVDGKWEDAYEGADASTTALMVRTLNGLESKVQELATLRAENEALKAKAALAYRGPVGKQGVLGWDT